MHELQSRWVRRRRNGRVVVGVVGLLDRAGAAVDDLTEGADGGFDGRWMGERSGTPAVSAEIVAMMVATGILGDGRAGAGECAEMVISSDEVGRCVHSRPRMEMPAIAKLTRLESRRVESKVFETHIRKAAGASVSREMDSVEIPMERTGLGRRGS